MADLPTSARVVIMGGGISGCSVAYHLAALGWTDVVQQDDLDAIAAPLDVLGVNYYRGDLVTGQGRAVAEVEAHAGGRVLAAGLGGVVGDDLVERLVHHVGGGVGAGDRPSSVAVDRRDGGDAGGELALDEARADFVAANNNPAVSSYAPNEFRQATEALERANQAAAKRESLDTTDRLASLAVGTV